MHVVVETQLELRMAYATGDGVVARTLGDLVDRWEPLKPPQRGNTHE
jgi:hypothetical protein